MIATRPLLLAAATLGLGGCTQAVLHPFEDAADALRRAAVTDEVALPPTERGRYAPGDTFVFTGGRTEHVLAVAKGRVTWSLVGKQRYVTNGNYVLPRLEWWKSREHGRHTIVNHWGELWPMQSGAHARYTVLREVTKTKSGKTRRQRRTYHCAVEGTERITVPAGTFDTFRVECLRYGHSSMKLVLRRTWHYAPEIGHYVRREIENKSRGTRRAFELMSYTRAAARAVLSP